MLLLFSRSVVSDSATPWTAACQASLSITSSGVYPNSCPSSWWCHPTIWSSVIPFSSRLQSFPASGSFPMSNCILILNYAFNIINKYKWVTDKKGIIELPVDIRDAGSHYTSICYDNGYPWFAIHIREINYKNNTKDLTRKLYVWWSCGLYLGNYQKMSLYGHYAEVYRMHVYVLKILSSSWQERHFIWLLAFWITMEYLTFKPYFWFSL